MISRNTRAQMTRIWIEKDRLKLTSDISPAMSVAVLPHARQQHGNDAVGDQAEYEGAENTAKPSRLDGIVGHVGLDDPLDIGLLAPGFVARLLKRGDRPRQLLVGDLAFKQDPLVLSGR